MVEIGDTVRAYSEGWRFGKLLEIQYKDSGNHIAIIGVPTPAVVNNRLTTVDKRVKVLLDDVEKWS